MTNVNALGKIREAAEAVLAGASVAFAIHENRAIVWTVLDSLRTERVFLRVVCEGNAAEMAALKPKVEQLHQLMVEAGRTGLGWLGPVVSSEARVN